MQGNHAERGHDGKYLSHQNEDLGNGKTKNIIAKQFCVGGSTVERAEHFVDGLNEAEKVSPGIKESVLSGEIKAPKNLVSEIRNVPEEKRHGHLQGYESGSHPLWAGNGNRECVGIKAEMPSYTSTCVAVFLRKIGGDTIEHPAYRDNLEQILKASNGRQMLTIGDVKEITGIRHYQTLHKMFPFNGRYISAATLALYMSGGGK